MTIKPEKNQWLKTDYSSGSGYHNQQFTPDGTVEGRLKRESWASGPSVANDYYRYTGKEGNWIGEPGVDAMVGVLHRPAQGSTEYPPKSVIEGPDPTPEGPWLPAPSNRNDVSQIKLLKHRSQHASSVINSAFSTKAARIAPLTGIGMAVNDTVQEFGRVPEPSTNLSKHSSRMVQKLQDRGVVGEGESYNANNGIDFWDPRGQERTVGIFDEPLSQERVEGGRKIMRQVARRPRKAEGVQMELPF